jgi:hypothetical protein
MEAVIRDDGPEILFQTLGTVEVRVGTRTGNRLYSIHRGVG